MNAGASDFRSAPSFFAVASSRPVSEIVDQRTAAIYELGTDFIQLSPSGQIDPEEQARYASGLVELRQRQGLFKQDPQGVRISEGVLYQARIALPSNVTTGAYTAETFAIARGRVLASATARIEVEKGRARRGQVVVAAQRWSLLYGMGAIALSLAMGVACRKAVCARIVVPRSGFIVDPILTSSALFLRPRPFRGRREGSA